MSDRLWTGLEEAGSVLRVGLLFFPFFSSSSLNRILRLRLSASMDVPLSNNVGCIV